MKKLFIGNLPFKVSGKDFVDADLQALFSSYGVEEAKVIIDRESGRSRGFGFVSITADESSDKAMQEMNGKDVGGRQIVVNVARERTTRSGGDNRDRGYQQR